MEETNKNKEKIFPHEFIFVFTPYITRAILPKRMLSIVGAWGGSIEGEFKPSAYFVPKQQYLHYKLYTNS